MDTAEQFAALEDHRGFLKMAKNVLTGDLQLISNALRSIFGRVFFLFFCFFTFTQLKKTFLTDALVIFPFNESPCVQS